MASYEFKNVSINILQWNCRSLNANLSCFKQFLMKYDISIAALSESWLRPDYPINIPGYRIVRDDRLDGRGGSALVIKNNLKHKVIHENIDQDINILVIEVTFGDRNLYISTIYIPPRININDNLRDFMLRYRDKFLMLGDVNCHSEVWGNPFSDVRGRKLLDYIDEAGLVILNDGSPTRINYANQRPTAVDISLATPDIALEFEWKVIEEPLGSDHLPIILKFNGNQLRNCPSGLRKRNISKADFNVYKYFIMQNIGNLDKTCPDYSEFLKLIDMAANLSIPYSNKYNGGNNSVKRMNPWWTEACDQLIKQRKEAFVAYRSNINYDNFIKYQKINAQTKRFLRATKKASWIKMCTKFNRTSPIRDIWKSVKIFKNSSAFGGEKADNVRYPRDLEWADSMFDTIAPAMPEDRYCADELSSEDSEAIKEITKNEMMVAIKSSSNTAPGLDEIYYPMLRYLPDEALEYLRLIFNKIVRKGDIPPEWMDQMVIPILKPGKDPQDTLAYRPIALTSCVKKTFERILKTRLEWWIEKNAILPPHQHGFRRSHSTMDNLATITLDILDHFICKEDTILISLDLSKAYDMVCPKILLNKLLELKVPMSRLLYELVRKKNLYIQTENGIHGPRTSYMGLPQGSPLSPLLFNIYTSDLKNYVEDSSIKILQYADDICIFCHCARIDQGMNKAERAMEKINNWIFDKGFSISENKSSITVFSRKHKLPVEEVVNLAGLQFPLRDQVKILGLWMDRKMTWKKHVQYVVKKCERSVNILRSLTRTWWGADPKILKILYQSIVRSHIDYALPIYGGTKKCHFKKLEQIQFKSLRIILGAMKSSPTNALEVEAGVMPLNLRCLLLGSRFLVKRIQDINNTSMVALFQVRRTLLQKNIRISGFAPLCTAFEEIRDLEPWLEKSNNHGIYGHDIEVLATEIPIYIDCFKDKNIPSSTIVNAIFNTYLEEVAPSSYKIFTDGSKDTDKGVGFGWYDPQEDKRSQFKGRNEMSVYSAEAMAILESLKYIESLNNHRSFVVVSDSMSVLKKINSLSLVVKEKTIPEIKEMFFKLKRAGKMVKFVWARGHCGIVGNEIVDSIAKEASSLQSITHTQLMPDEVGSVAKKKLIEKWQKYWEESSTGRGSHLFSINPVVSLSSWHNRIEGSRAFYSSLTRMRLNHGCFPSHLKRINVIDSGVCACDGVSEGTLNHIFWSCSLLKYRKESNFIGPEALSPLLSEVKKVVYFELFQFLQMNNIHI